MEKVDLRSIFVENDGQFEKRTNGLKTKYVLDNKLKVVPYGVIEHVK